MSFLKNRTVLFGGGVGILLLALATGFLFKGFADYYVQNRHLDLQYRRLAGLNARHVFPSLENIALTEKKLEKLEQQAAGLVAALCGESTRMPQEDAAAFAARSQKVAGHLRERITENGIIHGDSLDMVFSDYMGGGMVPADRYVLRLSRQLDAVETLLELLVQSGVYSIDHLAREHFESPIADSAAVLARRRFRPDTSAAGKTKGGLGQAGSVHHAGLYSSEQLEVVFTSCDAVVWTVLNEIVTAPRGIIIRDFSHRTQTDILSFVPVETGPLKKQARDSTAIQSRQPSRPERIVSGRERVRVSLRLEVLYFDPIAAGERL